MAHKTSELLVLFLISTFLITLVLTLPGCEAPKPNLVKGNLASWLDGVHKKESGPDTKPDTPPGHGKKPKALTQVESMAIRSDLEKKLADKTSQESPAIGKLRRGLTRMENGQLDHAAVEFKDLLRLQPDNFVVLCLLANLCLRQGKHDQALAFTHQALALAPEDQETRLIKAQICALSPAHGGHAQALAIYRDLSTDNFPDGRLEHLHARALVAMGKFKEAHAVATRGVEKHGASIRLLEDLVDILLRLGRNQEAAATCKKMIEPPHGPALERLWHYALVLRRAGNFSKASDIVDSILGAGEKELKVFHENRVARPDLDKFAELIKREKKSGQRAGYMNNEALAICVAPGKPEERLLAFNFIFRTRSNRVYERAVEAALASKVSKLRCAAIKAIGQRVIGKEKSIAILRQTLADPDFKARAMSAYAIGRLAFFKQSAELLLAALEKEEQGYAFSCIATTLASVTGKKVFFMDGEEEEPRSRQRIRKEWKEILKK